MSRTLTETLHLIRVDALMRQADAIRDFSDSDDRLEEARKMIRAVLYEFALGRLDAETRDQILSALNFARTRPAVILEEPIPTYQDDEARRELQEDTPKKQQTFFSMP